MATTHKARIAPQQRIDELRRTVVLLAAANEYHRISAKMHADERLEAVRHLASSGLFGKSHVAKILGYSKTTIARLPGVEWPKKKLGGSINPAQLLNVIEAILRKTREGTFGIQYIKEAADNGMSTAVLARLLGVSGTYVLKMLKKAEEERAHTLEQEAARPGRAGHRRVRTVQEWDRISRIAKRKAEAAAMRARVPRDLDGQRRLLERVYGQAASADPFSSAASDEAGRPDGTDVGTEAGAAHGTGTDHPADG